MLFRSTCFYLKLSSFSIHIWQLLTAETLVEALNTSAGVNQLLLTSVERMALGANFDVDLRLGGTSLDDVTASAGDGAVNVIRMDTLLHSFSPHFWF